MHLYELEKLLGLVHLWRDKSSTRGLRTAYLPTLTLTPHPTPNPHA